MYTPDERVHCARPSCSLRQSKEEEEEAEEAEEGQEIEKDWRSLERE
jgi:hypothetical protein